MFPCTLKKKIKLVTKKKVQQFVTRFQFEIYIFFQLGACLTVLLLNFSFEAFITIILWLDVSSIFNFLFILDVPVIFLTASFFLIIRIILFLYYFDLGLFLITTALLEIAYCHWFFFSTFQWFKDIKAGYEKGQLVIQIHFKELAALGSLSCLLTVWFIVLTFFLVEFTQGLLPICLCSKTSLFQYLC